MRKLHSRGACADEFLDRGLCRRLKHGGGAAFSDVPVVLLSALSEPEGIRCWTVFLRKPASIEVLLDTVDKLIATRLTCAPARRDPELSDRGALSSHRLPMLAVKPFPAANFRAWPEICIAREPLPYQGLRLVTSTTAAKDGVTRPITAGTRTPVDGLMGGTAFAAKRRPCPFT
ncbi:hypothetical protein QFZ96_008121 [Paraburkholderia youngii]